MIDVATSALAVSLITAARVFAADARILLGRVLGAGVRIGAASLVERHQEPARRQPARQRSVDPPPGAQAVATGPSTLCAPENEGAR
ncbi:hypothetical protein [Streptomyces sp. SAJ15]|uniref:hypothetical protein n=1 Tax=Streptomyces sp. SAJ15 TaxID=2011095 RepID=UPI0011872C3D|nr:hypothetical protein [Streptomyces sp. SAJ15]TVL90539.1 hypothetical protein CD790_21460 [Streptomyces sp. SAJ15]